MASMYKGKQRFDREQLIFVVEALMAAAMDSIADCLPPEIPRETYAQRKEAIHEAEQSAKAVVLHALPILYAQLTGDGMGVGEFRCENIFRQMVELYTSEIEFRYFVKDDYTGEPPRRPNFREVARQFVDYEFADYFAEAQTKKPAPTTE